MVVAWDPHQTGKQLRGQRELLKVSLAAAFSVVLYAPWIPILLQQKTRVAESFWIAPCCLTQVAAAWDAAVFPEVKFEQWHKTRGLLSLITTAIILIVIQVRATVVDRLVLVLSAAPSLLAILVSITSTSIITNRYLILIHCSVLFAVARGLQKWLQSTAAVALTFLIALNCLWLQFEYAHRLDPANRTGPRGALEWIQSIGVSEDPIYVLHPCVYFSLRYHAQRQDLVRLCTNPENVLHYTGQPLLRRRERMDPYELSRINADRIFVLDSTGFTSGYRRPLLSNRWKQKRTRRFPCPYRFEGDVVVTEYIRIEAFARSFTPVNVVDLTEEKPQR